MTNTATRRRTKTVEFMAQDCAKTGKRHKIWRSAIFEAARIGQGGRNITKGLYFAGAGRGGEMAILPRKGGVFVESRGASVAFRVGGTKQTSPSFNCAEFVR